MRRFGKIQVITLTALTLLCSCGKGSKDAKVAKDETPKVKLAFVKSEMVEQLQEFTATVESDVKNNIAPFTPVRIERIFVEVGDRVRKGQKLVQMDGTTLKQTKAQLDNLRMEFNRVDELYKVGGTSKSEWDAKKMSLEVMQTSYRNLVQNVCLVSPINGVVTARNYDSGDMFGGGIPILTVEQIAPVKLIINVSEDSFTKIKKGMEAKVKLDVYGDEEFVGRVSLIHPTVDNTTRTFPIEITLPNKDQRVRPGMFARVTLNYGTMEHVVVPDLAVVKQIGSGDKYVYVYQNGKVSYNKVTLGRRMGAEYELVSGVPNNSQVVVAGQAKLANGASVKVEK